jgi:hypothetical protein
MATSVELEKGHEKLKLHLGCGEVYLQGYLNIDFPPSAHTVLATEKANLHADITQLCYAPESVAEVRLHHVLEHFSRATGLRLLIEWYAWLEQDGKLVIETPDFDGCIRRIVAAPCSFRQRMALIRHIFGSQEASWALHLGAWDATKLTEVLGRLGFRRLIFSFSEWKGTYNVCVQAHKTPPLVLPEKQLEAAKELLELSLVDHSESEREMLQVWLQELAERAS